MHIEISEVTQEEFDLVKQDFAVNAQALANMRRFRIVDGDKVIVKLAKPWRYQAFDRSKFLKAVIDGNTYIVAAGEVFRGIIEDVLVEAATRFPQSFGNKNAHSVVKAIFDTRPLPMFENMEQVEESFATEKFAMAFKIHSDGSVDRNVLRLDLFRMIKNNPENKNETEFVGGVMHAFKHFNVNGLSLSTKPGENPIYHPSEVIAMAIKSYFEVEHIPQGKGFVTELPIGDGKVIKCSFYPEEDLEISFLNSLYFSKGKKK